MAHASFASAKQVLVVKQDKMQKPPFDVMCVSEPVGSESAFASGWFYSLDDSKPLRQQTGRK